MEFNEKINEKINKKIDTFGNNDFSEISVNKINYLNKLFINNLNSENLTFTENSKYKMYIDIPMTNLIGEPIILDWSDWVDIFGEGGTNARGGDLNIGFCKNCRLYEKLNKFLGFNIDAIDIINFLNKTFDINRFRFVDIQYNLIPTFEKKTKLLEQIAHELLTVITLKCMSVEEKKYILKIRLFLA